MYSKEKVLEIVVFLNVFIGSLVNCINITKYHDAAPLIIKIWQTKNIFLSFLNFYCCTFPIAFVIIGQFYET